MANALQFEKNERGQVVAKITSEGQTDLRAVVDDPASQIVTLATLAGLRVEVTERVQAEGTPPAEDQQG